jgi:PAS domain S-box-containing protein
MEESHRLTADIRTEIEHRKRVMQTLSTSEEKYRRLLEQSPTLIMELDRDLRILSVNQAMKKSLGVPNGHLIGTPAADLVDEKTAARRRQIIHEALDSDQIIRVQEERQGRIFQSTYIPSPSGQRLQVISYDITLLKKTEQELIRYQEHLEELVEEKTKQLEQEAAERIRAEKAALSAQKLADLGMLTTGVAHELNSPLQSILTWSEVLLLALRANDLDQNTVSLIKEHLNNIKQSVLRCSKIVSSLRYYAHTHHLEYKTCQLDEILEDTLVLIDHQLKDLDIRVETEIQDDLPAFFCMRYQISQLLVNLLINARDAVGEHGKIKVTLAHQPDPGMFEIRVADSGEGIHPDIEEEIFKPFFTTKEVGQGTGLGLFIVSGIVEAHGGEIQVESELGTGTEFIITFPEQLPEDLPVNPVIKGRYSDMVD